MPHTPITTTDAPQAIGTYSQAMRAGAGKRKRITLGVARGSLSASGSPLTSRPTSVRTLSTRLFR